MKLTPDLDTVTKILFIIAVALFGIFLILAGLAVIAVYTLCLDKNIVAAIAFMVLAVSMAVIWVIKILTYHK